MHLNLNLIDTSEPFERIALKEMRLILEQPCCLQALPASRPALQKTNIRSLYTSSCGALAVGNAVPKDINTIRM